VPPPSLGVNPGVRFLVLLLASPLRLLCCLRAAHALAAARPAPAALGPSLGLYTILLLPIL